MTVLAALARWLAVLVVGAAAALFWWRLTADRGDAIVIGPWRGSLAAGSNQADMRTKAYIATTALLALNRSETIYFNADYDDDGRRLASECRYDIAGGELPARWWSITAYAGDHFLIPNSLNRYSFSMTNVKRAADGGFVIVAGPARLEGDWLPTGERGKGLSFLIRLYNPEAGAASDPGAIKLPSIRRVGDCT